MRRPCKPTDVGWGVVVLADTLMAYLPAEPAYRLVHKEDLERFELRFNARMEGLEARMDRFETRMDRLFLAILAGSIGVAGTLVAASFAT